MPRTVWKIDLPAPGDLHHADLPGNWRIVAADLQDGTPRAWVEVEPDLTPVARPVHVVGTGWPIPAEMYGADVEMQHRATFIDTSGLVWHVYEGVTRRPW